MTEEASNALARGYADAGRLSYPQSRSASTRVRSVESELIPPGGAQSLFEVGQNPRSRDFPCLVASPTSARAIGLVRLLSDPKADWLFKLHFFSTPPWHRQAYPVRMYRLSRFFGVGMYHLFTYQCDRLFPDGVDIHDQIFFDFSRAFL